MTDTWCSLCQHSKKESSINGWTAWQCRARKSNDGHCIGFIEGACFVWKLWKME